MLEKFRPHGGFPKLGVTFAFSSIAKVWGSMALSERHQKFDPFAHEAARVSISTRSWLLATALQGVFTSGLLGLAWWAKAKPWRVQADMIMLVGIVATWSLALRTIRERLIELTVYWQKASKGLIRRASESGRHLIQVPLSEAREKYIKGSIWRLKVIAAGLTIPLFVMPLAWSFVAIYLSLRQQPLSSEQWGTFAIILMLSAFIVGGYFHWAIGPRPLPVRVSVRSSGSTRV